MKKLIYFFDYISPYSFFSFFNPVLAEIKNKVEIEYRPVVLAKLLSHFDIKGPGEIEPKRDFMLKQCFRMAHQKNIKFQTPKVHPFNPLYALRLSTYTLAGANQEEMIRVLWRGAWQEGLDMGDPDVIEAWLDHNNLDGKSLLEKIFKREVKEELKENVKLALSYKAFGVPSFIYEGELFWGNDSLLDLLRTIKGEDHWNKELFYSAIEKANKQE